MKLNFTPQPYLQYPRPWVSQIRHATDDPAAQTPQQGQAETRKRAKMALDDE
jgi:hypothetical protein